MEYIEPKPVEEKPHAKRNKIIIGSVIGSLTLAAIGVGTYFLIDKIFLDYNNIELYTYTYRLDENGKANGSIITKTKLDVSVPSNLRIPRRLGGQPVVEIADNAFQYQSDIVSINFPDSLEYIGSYAFSECKNLEKFNTPKNLKFVGTRAFEETAWLDSAYDGEVMIGDLLYAYKGYIDDNTILVGSANSSLINEYPTSNVINLDEYINMSSGVFEDQPGIIAVEYPSKYEEVNDDMFYGCTSIEKIVLPSSIKRIGNNAFAFCSGLTSNPDFSHIEYIGDAAFAYSNISGELTFSEGLLDVGFEAFRGNKELTKVRYNSNQQNILDYTFEDCEKLEEVIFPDSEYVPATSHIDSIGSSAFAKTNIKSFCVPFNVRTIHQSAFSGCEELETLKLYNNVTGTHLNKRSETDTGYTDWKIDEDFYQGVSSLGVKAFEDSFKFKEIILVNKENEAVSMANSVHIPVSLSTIGGSDSRIFAMTSVTSIDLTQETTENTPRKFGGLSTIAIKVFEDARELVNINLGKTITTIEESAFRGCVKLQSVVIPLSVTRLDASIFQGCSALESVTFEKSEVLSSSVTKIHNYAFQNCTSLAMFAIPSKVTEIGNNAFDGCTSIQTISFITDDKGVRLSIAKEAFQNCTSLVSINIPSYTNSISERAFKNCSSLEELELPKNINSIGDGVIDGTTSLTKLTLNAAKVVSVNTNNIDSETGMIKNTGLTTVYVPANLVEQYNNHTLWSHYTIVAIAA